MAAYYNEIDPYAALRPRKDQGSRTGRLRGYGNAINAEAATQFILAARDILTT